MFDWSGRRARRDRCRAALLAALVAGGCEWDAWVPPQRLPRDPDADRRNAIPLVPGEVHTDRLHCKAGDCRDWFVVATERPGELTVEVRPAPADEPASLRVVLFGQGAGAADHTSWDEAPPLRVRTVAPAGAFFVLVEGHGGRLPFEIVARHRPEKP